MEWGDPAIIGGDGSFAAGPWSPPHSKEEWSFPDAEWKTRVCGLAEKHAEFEDAI